MWKMSTVVAERTSRGQAVRTISFKVSAPIQRLSHLLKSISQSKSHGHSQLQRGGGRLLLSLGAKGREA